MSDHHDEAEAYRNRAERAEQEAAELRAHVERLEVLAKMLADRLERVQDAVGTAGNDLIAYTHRMIR